MPGQCRRLAEILALSFFVVVSLCRTPIPWVHRHDGAEKNDQFAEHLAAYHADGDEETGWHVHFSMVNDILRGNGCPVPPSENEPDPADLQLKSLAAIVSFSIVNFSIGGNQQACPISIVVARLTEISFGAQQHDCASSRALRIALCVSRC
ncbi:MAG TPA: hypothetical protein EYG03_26190 [Planctomycetes bacterium]|nr:hypothetical protein [Fuerstiella sp.]HIK95451.1 hypothetical protein [Planctomycetota bacterium]